MLWDIKCSPNFEFMTKSKGTQAEQEQRRSHSPLKSEKINPLESLTDSVLMLSTEDIKENRERLCALDNQSQWIVICTSGRI